MDKTEHHIMVVVRSTKPYLEVMSRLVGAAKKEFGGAEVHGHDPKKAEQKLHDFAEERNLAVAEAHRLRCEGEFFLRTLADISGRPCECHPGSGCCPCLATLALTELAKAKGMK